MQANISKIEISCHAAYLVSIAYFDFDFPEKEEEDLFILGWTPVP